MKQISGELIIFELYVTSLYVSLCAVYYYLYNMHGFNELMALMENYASIVNI